jgi:ATP-dependent 26S proteasome regulatory subunit
MKLQKEKKVGFGKKYQSHTLLTKLLDYLSDNNISYEIGPEKNYQEYPIFIFNEKTGGFDLVSGKILIKEYPLSNTNLNLEIIASYDEYKEVLDVFVVLPEKYRNYQPEIFKMLDGLSEEKVEEKIKPDRVRFKLDFEDKSEAFNSIIKVLDENKLTYEIKSHDREEEPVYSWKNGKRYLEKGKISINEDFYFEFNPFGIYMISPKNDKRIDDLIQKLSPQRVDIYQEKIINIFGGKKIKLKDYTWDDVGGLDKQKEEIKQIIEWPLQNPDILEYMGLRQPKGVLLYGPPGTGKTLISKVIACETNAYLFHTTPSELTSKWYGESEKLVRELFNLGRQYKPSIILIDEIDGLFTSRESGMHEATRRMFSVFLQELDGFEDLKGTIILATTNRIEDLDPALLRPGRFDRKIEIPLPDEKSRRKIFEIHTRKMPLDESVDFDYLAKITDGCSGADIEYICQKAGYKAVERYMKQKNINITNITREEFKKIKINQQDFEIVIEENL